MPETVNRGGKVLTFYDLSDCLSNETSAFEPNRHHIEYSAPEDTAVESETLLGLGPAYWPDRKAWAVEVVTLSTHSGTHVDAPAHYGPSGRSHDRTIDEVPLSWCFGDGVRLDMTGIDRVEGITGANVGAELNRIGYTLKPYDIVLMMTGASRNFERPGYEHTHAGLRRDATEFLVDKGVRLIGIDAWGIDRAFDVMIAEARAGTAQFWESHLLGREKEYCQIERLANLDRLPRPFGFTVCAFPCKLERASGGWARVVAIFEDG